MSPYQQAKDEYNLICGNAEEIQAVRAEHLALIKKWRTGSGGMQITGGTEMGQTFTATWSRTEEDRKHYLSILIGMLNRGTAGSNHITPRFC